MTTAVANPAATGVTHPSWRGTNVATQIMVLTGRSLRAIIRDPRMIIFSLLQPLVMLLLFSQIFASIAKTPGFPHGTSYIDFLMPAILVNTAMGAAVQGGVGLVNDMKNGVLARFRSLPIRLGSVLVARSLSDMVRTGVQLTIMLIFAALLFGFAPAGGLPGVAGAWALGLIVGWGLGWVFIAAGAWLRNAEVMQMVGFLLMFPLMFASSAYMPVDSMPTWIRFLARGNPLTYAIDATRALALGRPVGWSIVWALGLVTATALLGGTAAARNFRRAS